MRASRQEPFTTLTADSSSMEESGCGCGCVSKNFFSAPRTSVPAATASAMGLATSLDRRKSLILPARTLQSSSDEARLARWPTVSPAEMSTSVKASGSPARLTKTLPAGALAAAAEKGAGGAADEGPAPAEADIAAAASTASSSGGGRSAQQAAKLEGISSEAHSAVGDGSGHAKFAVDGWRLLCRVRSRVPLLSRSVPLPSSRQ